MEVNWYKKASGTLVAEYDTFEFRNSVPGWKVEYEVWRDSYDVLVEIIIADKGPESYQRGGPEVLVTLGDTKITTPLKEPYIEVEIPGIGYRSTVSAELQYEPDVKVHEYQSIHPYKPEVSNTTDLIEKNLSSGIRVRLYEGAPASTPVVLPAVELRTRRKRWK